MKRFASFIVCIYILSITEPITGAWGPRDDGTFLTAEVALIEKLKANYNPIVRPVKRANETVVVALSIALANIYDVDEKNKLLKIKGWIHQEWKDHHFQWDPASNDNIERIVLPENDVWKPDIRLYNYAENMYSDAVSGRVRVTYDGNITWVPLNTMIKASCSFKMRHFPYDTQTCKLMFGSWVYPSQEVNITIGEHHKNQVFYAGDEWEIKEITFKTHVFGDYEDGVDGDSYTVAVLTISLRRHGAYYTHVFVTPCVLLAIVTLLMYLVPPQSGERFTLGSTVIIGCTLLLLMLENHLPVEVSDVPYIASYLIFVYVMVVMAIIMSVIVMNFHHRDIRRGKIPNWMRQYILNKFSAVVCMKGDTYQSVPTNNPGALNLDTDTTLPDLEGGSPSDLRVDKELFDDTPLPPNSKMALEETLEEIRGYLRVCAAKATMPEPPFTHREILINEWHHLALVVDRILFVLFLFITILTTIIMF